MTVISTLYDSFSTFVDTAINADLTESYVKIPNPYTFIDNPEILLNKCYGVAFLDGVPDPEGVIGCKLALERDVEFSIVRQITADDFDTADRNTLEKEIFEHQFKVIKAVHEDPTIDGAVANTNYVSDSGLLYLQGEGIPARFFLLTTVFTMNYYENLGA